MRPLTCYRPSAAVLLEPCSHAGFKNRGPLQPPRLRKGTETAVVSLLYIVRKTTPGKLPRRQVIAQTIAANTLPAAAGIAAIAILHVLRFIAFHGRLSLLLENNHRYNYRAHYSRIARRRQGPRPSPINALGCSALLPDHHRAGSSYRLMLYGATPSSLTVPESRLSSITTFGTLPGSL